MLKQAGATVKSSLPHEPLKHGRQHEPTEQHREEASKYQREAEPDRPLHYGPTNTATNAKANTKNSIYPAPGVGVPERAFAVVDQ